MHLLVPVLDLVDAVIQYARSMIQRAQLSKSRRRAA